VKLKRREEILLIVFAGLLGLCAAWFLLFSGGSRSYSQLVALREQLSGELQKKTAAVKAAKTASKRLADWQRRALPSEVSDARLHYRIWLRQLVDRIQFQQATVEATGEQSRAKTCTLLKFRVHGRTNLAKLTEFLWEFYSAGHLHLISLIELTAVPNSPDVDVNIDVDAMSLPGADRKTELAKEPGKSLRLASLADYGKIAERNFFRPFQPPAVQPESAPTILVTAILRTERRGEVWLVDRPSNKDWKLHEDEHFDAGKLKGTVKTIGTRAVAIEIDGCLGQYRCGDTLKGGDAGRGLPGQPAPPGADGKSPNAAPGGPPPQTLSGDREEDADRPRPPPSVRPPRPDGEQEKPEGSEQKAGGAQEKPDGA